MITQLKMEHTNAESFLEDYFDERNRSFLEGVRNKRVNYSLFPEESYKKELALISKFGDPSEDEKNELKLRLYYADSGGVSFM